LALLSDKEILEHLKRGKIRITHFQPSCLNPAGYDLRSAKELTIEPKQHSLIATLETVELDLTIMSTLHIRSSLAREGIIGSFAVVDPGFCGQLTLNLHNDGEHVVRVRKGEPIVQIVFHKLGERATKGYSGVYQHSKGIVRSKRRQVEEATGHLGSTPSFQQAVQHPNSYPQPPKR